jgi:hypothetical protein
VYRVQKTTQQRSPRRPHFDQYGPVTYLARRSSLSSDEFRSFDDMRLSGAVRRLGLMHDMGGSARQARGQLIFRISHFGDCYFVYLLSVAVVIS